MATKMMSQTFVNKAVTIAKEYKTAYMWGVFGSPVTETVITAKTKQYPSWYTAARQAALRKLIGKGYFAFDCVGLIKGILWGWNGSNGKSYGGARYASNGVPDTNANGMISRCSSVSTTGWTSMVPGELLWMQGHVGIYIGDGLAVECTPSWAGGVQITAVKNIGTKSGYKARSWKKHGKLPWVDYSDQTVTETPTPEKSVEEVAQEVIRGLWGNGLTRHTRLTAAGYDYVAVQRKVNELLKK